MSTSITLPELTAAISEFHERVTRLANRDAETVRFVEQSEKANSEQSSRRYMMVQIPSPQYTMVQIPPPQYTMVQIPPPQYTMVQLQPNYTMVQNQPSDHTVARDLKLDQVDEKAEVLINEAKRSVQHSDDLALKMIDAEILMCHERIQALGVERKAIKERQVEKEKQKMIDELEAKLEKLRA